MNLQENSSIYTQRDIRDTINSLTFIGKFSIIVCNYFFEGEVSPNGMAAAWKAVGG